MSRFLTAGFGGLVAAAVFWVVFGSIAALVFSQMPGGAREGGGAMAGFFFVGPVCGIVGMALGGWVVWRLLAIPERMSGIVFGLAGVLAALVAGVMIAMQPAMVTPDDFEGHRAEWRVEVRFPEAALAGVAAADRLIFEFRSGDGTEETPALRAQMRRENGRAVIPGVFVTRTRPRSKLLAVMKNDSQLMCSTLTVEGNPQGSTDWSEWQDLEAGFQARWRLTVAEGRGK